MEKTKLVVIIIFLLFLNIFQFAWNHIEYRKYATAVPDEQTAIEIGKAILVATFGDGMLEGEPFEAVYIPNRKAWWVASPLPYNAVGGTPQVIIRERDAKVLSLSISGM